MLWQLIKRQVKIQKLFVSLIMFFGVVFVSFASIISSYVITNTSIILGKYLPFSELHIEEFQI